MSRPLHEPSSDQAPAKGAVRTVMVYVCECGAKWINSAKPAWECKCGRPLVKRNGIIHTALGHASVQTSSRTRSARFAV